MGHGVRIPKVFPGGSHFRCFVRCIRSGRQDSGFWEPRQDGEAMGRGVRITKVFPGGSHWR
eukprot:794636-Rhodomonas_salina.1